MAAQESVHPTADSRASPKKKKKRNPERRLEFSVFQVLSVKTFSDMK